MKSLARQDIIDAWGWGKYGVHPWLLLNLSDEKLAARSLPNHDRLVAELGERLKAQGESSEC